MDDGDFAFQPGNPPLTYPRYSPVFHRLRLPAAASATRLRRPIHSMRKPQPDLIAFSLLLLSCALIAWTGTAGPVFAESFWTGLEDWQTSIAAVIALLAAYLAARPVYRQLAEQRRQSAAAAVSMIVKAAVSLEEERDIIRKAVDDLRIDRLLWEYDELSWHDIYSSWPEDAFGLMTVCDTALRSVRLYAERNPDASATQRCRVEAIAALEQLRAGLTDLVTIMRQQTSGLSYEEGEEDIPVKEHQTRRQEVNVKDERWRIAAHGLDIALSMEIANVWRRIRQLESIAIGAFE
ncbi:hypothetical protein GGD66_006994 [Bradyrhizobium sp. CIR48]|uniref:hypothetical protein n=1 Tax=Bradyrhizobium sp. CIR48 TaxID=2663840 RepID=UPI001606E60E|nr:hypothetical protein [Bradyrhizobium sp. CIR48]MBB4428407.1 hypothetical protein [Bradyrhizobium sp. CIR48]